MKKLIVGLTVGVPVVVPLVAGAAINNINDVLAWIAYAINNFIYIIISLAVLVIIWGVFRYLIAGAADEESRKSGRSYIIWGIVGLVVILSLWGLVNIVVNSLGVNTIQRSNVNSGTINAGGIPSQSVGGGIPTQ